jgi:hypothetical protein
MEAADVFPYLEMLVKQTAGSTPRRDATASRIRWFAW